MKKNILVFLVLVLFICSSEQQVYPQIRIHGDFSLMGQPGTLWRNYFENVLFPPIKDYLQATFKVKYPVEGLLNYTTGPVCGFQQIPQFLQDGIAADLVVFFKNDTDTQIARSSACDRSQALKGRPVLAASGYQPTSLEIVDPHLNPLKHEYQTVTVLHEIFHCLAFDPELFPFFINPATGNPFGIGILGTYHLGANSFRYITAQPVAGKFREHFNCSSLPGALFDNIAAGHWERQWMATEFMATGGDSDDARISEISLALIETSGWYVANYSMADPFNNGKNRGCSFIWYSQSTANWYYDKAEHCDDPGTFGCNIEGITGGICGSNAWTDSRNIYLTHSNNHCQNEASNVDPDSFAADTALSLQSRGRFSNSRCFNGNIYDAEKSGLDYTYCFNYQCLENNTLLKVKIGSTYYNCTAKATIPVTINNANNKLYCPDPKQFCSTKGKMFCPRGCMGRGVCVEGQCHCNSGYAGLDCGYDA